MRTTLLSASIFVVAGFGAGCLPTNDPPSARDAAKMQLANQRMMFDLLGPTSYVVTEQQGCFCAPETTAAMRVTVTGGSVSSAVYVADGTVVPDNVKTGVKTVADVFDLIAQQLDDGHAMVTVTYDPVGYYPTQVESSVTDALDSGLTISLSNLATRTNLSEDACRDIEHTAQAAEQSVIATHLACKVASDCMAVSFDASCFEACSAVIATSGLAALQAANAAVEANQCVTYHLGGCTLIEPPCVAPPPQLYCNAGVCQGFPPQ